MPAPDLQTLIDFGAMIATDHQWQLNERIGARGWQTDLARQVMVFGEGGDAFELPVHVLGGELDGQWMWACDEAWTGMPDPVVATARTVVAAGVPELSPARIPASTWSAKAITFGAMPVARIFSAVSKNWPNGTATWYLIGWDDTPRPAPSPERTEAVVRRAVETHRALLRNHQLGVQSYADHHGLRYADTTVPGGHRTTITFPDGRRLQVHFDATYQLEGMHLLSAPAPDPTPAPAVTAAPAPAAAGTVDTRVGADAKLDASVDTAAFLCAEHAHELQRVAAGRRWHVDLNQGTLTFGDPGTPTTTYPVQLLGSAAQDVGTWLWAHANINNFPAAVVADAVELSRIPVPALQTAELPLTEDLPKRLTLVAATLRNRWTYHVLEPREGTQVWLLLGEQGVHLPDPTVLSVTGAITSALRGVAIVDHRRALLEYARWRGMDCVPGDGGYVLSAVDGQVQVRLDAQGRISDVSGRAGRPS